MAAGACTSRPSRPGAFFTSVTPFRFDRELVVFPAVLPEMWSKIAVKANARGWCDYRSPAPLSLP
jgi:hypothetical protein